MSGTSQETTTVSIRFSERLLDRVDARVEAGDFETRSDLLREGARRIALEAEVSERLETEHPIAPDGGSEVVTEFRERIVSAPVYYPPGDVEMDADETTATCSMCGAYGIVSDDPMIKNADAEDRLVCKTCDRERGVPPVNPGGGVRE